MDVLKPLFSKKYSTQYKSHHRRQDYGEKGLKLISIISSHFIWWSLTFYVKESCALMCDNEEWLKKKSYWQCVGFVTGQ